MIACIGWGSLVWDPGNLPVGGAWRDDGPLLPVEFARQSSRDRLTLVLVPGVKAVRTLWAPLAVSSRADAREALRRRESVKQPNRDRDIALWSRDDDDHDDPTRSTVARWARGVGLDAVVWTALPPRFDEQQGRVPSEDEAVAYLRQLQKRRAHAEAEKYIRMTPRQVDTVYRRRFEIEFDWRPAAEAP